MATIVTRAGKGSKLTSAEADANFTNLNNELAEKAVSTTLAASGGSALLGFLQSGTGATARTAQAKLRDFVSVKDFGAVGDGVTDDTAAIQAAIDAGLDVLVPGVSSYYKLTSQLNLGSNQTLFGNGPKSTLRQTTANANVVSISGKTNACVSGLTLHAVGSVSATDNGQGVHIEASASRCSVVGCVITNHRGAGVGVKDSSDCIVRGNWFVSSPVSDSDNHSQARADISFEYASSRNIAAHNVCISGQLVGIQVQTVDVADVADDNQIVGNIVLNAKGYGIMAYRLNPASDHVRRTIIADNIVDTISGTVVHSTEGQVYGTGIYVQGAEDTVVSGNVVRNTHSGAGTFLTTLSPAGIAAVNVSGVTISNNRVDTDPQWGIHVNDANNQGAATGFALVSNNEIRNTGKDAIRITERSRVKIAGNTIDTTSNGCGIFTNFTTARTGVSITGNTLRNIAGANGFGIQATYCDRLLLSANQIETTSQTGIILVSTLSNPVVSNNVVYGSGVHGIVIQDSDDFVLSGNNVSNPTTRGIQIVSTCARGVVTGNVVRGNGTTSDGIRLDAKCTIGPNEVTNCVTNWSGNYAELRGYAKHAAVGTAGTGEDNLITFSLPASSISENGEGVRIVAWGRALNTANAKTLKLYFGATAILTTSLTVSQVCSWRIEAEVIRTGSNAQKYIAQLIQGGTTTLISALHGTLTETDTSAITIKCTGEATSDNDIVQEGMVVSFLDN